MPFDGKPLGEITEAALSQLIRSGMAEHLQLEYKSQLYGNDHEGHREYLQDICMFANAQGGLLLIGVNEQRDGQGKPTGIPDPAAPLGIEVQNAEAILLGYDASVVSCIEERLPVESSAIPVGNGRFVFAFRVPNSVAKPHSVKYDKHCYFPSRRERNRYPMDVREIKELAMRTASQLDRAEQLLRQSINIASRGDDVLIKIAITPIFIRDFGVDIRRQEIQDAAGRFNVLSEREDVRITEYGFDGLERQDEGGRPTLTFMRNGIIRVQRFLIANRAPGQERAEFYPAGIDIVMRRFLLRARNFYEVAQVAGPFLLALKLQIPGNWAAQLSDNPAFPHTVPIGPIEFDFPSIVIDSIDEPPESAIRPLCDHLHQAFGQQRSPNFDAAGAWIGRQ